MYVYYIDVTPVTGKNMLPLKQRYLLDVKSTHAILHILRFHFNVSDFDPFMISKFPISRFHFSGSDCIVTLQANLSNCAVYIYTRIASHMDNYMLRVLELANQTISISAQTME
jgi:hypothetical protein